MPIGELCDDRRWITKLTNRGLLAGRQILSSSSNDIKTAAVYRPAHSENCNCSSVIGRRSLLDSTDCLRPILKDRYRFGFDSGLSSPCSMPSRSG
jgi:hypothetical protein